MPAYQFLFDDFKKLISKVRALMKNSEDTSNRKWTNEIKNEFCRYAKKFNLTSSASETAKSDYGEWLYDLVLYRMSDAAGQEWEVIDTPIILESEWGNRDEIRYDFQKLMLGRADVRVMIFQVTNHDGFSAIIEELVNQAQNYQRSMKGDRYYFAVYLWSTGEFEFHEYTVN